MSGLHLITLPIGNFEDITLKALNQLKALKIFYAEDTRVFKECLSHYGISYNDLIIDSFHDHSDSKVKYIIDQIISGKEIGLVSDAGSPVISDPAYPLIKEAIKNQIPIYNYSGITSVICALELSGLPSNPFHFWGFIGRTKGERKSFFEKCNSIYGTHICFESPHRIYETIENFFETGPEKTIVVARELTKKFQTVYRLNKMDMESLKKEVVDKGEFVILFHNDQDKKSFDSHLAIEVEDYISGKGNTKKLAKIFATILDKDARDIYNQMNLNKKS